MRRRETLAFAVLALAGACRKKPRRSPTMTAVPRGWSETGIASWYGHPYHGRRAANGEIYDMEQLTAAHKTLPFDTIVKVTSLANGKSVTVRITDRGPFIEGRVIDLSRAAARQIGMIGPGIMRVRLEAVAQASLRGNGGGARFGVQVGVFQDRSRAERVRRELEERYAPVRLVEREGSAKQWRVLVGDKASQQDALELAAELQRTHAGAFVVRIDADAR